MATLAAPAAIAISSRNLGVIYPELPALVIFHRDSGREKSYIDLSKYAASKRSPTIESWPQRPLVFTSISVEMKSIF